MKTTKEKYAELSNALSNTKAPIIGVHKFIKIYENPSNGRKPYYNAISNWREFGEDKFDTTFTASVLLNSLFNRFANKPVDIKNEKELEGKTIQVENFSFIIDDYGKSTPCITWTLYNQADIALNKIHPSQIVVPTKESTQSNTAEIVRIEEKRIKTIFIDGVELPDPSDAFTFEMILTEMMNDPEHHKIIDSYEHSLEDLRSNRHNEIDSYEEAMVNSGLESLGRDETDLGDNY